MTKEELKKRILAEVEKKDDVLYLSCKKAHEISDDLDVSLGRIGKVCNEETVRIKSCQLGCF